MSGQGEGFMIIGRDAHTKWEVRIVYTREEANAVRAALTKGQQEDDITYSVHLIGPELTPPDTE